MNRGWLGNRDEPMAPIPSDISKNPNLLMIAETYWNLEWELQRQGFDFCYDKILSDRLVSGSAEKVNLHLPADTGYQGKLLKTNQ